MEFSQKYGLKKDGHQITISNVGEKNRTISLTLGSSALDELALDKLKDLGRYGEYQNFDDTKLFSNMDTCLTFSVNVFSRDNDQIRTSTCLILGNRSGAEINPGVFFW